MIKINSLSKMYKNADRFAVKNLSLIVNDGEVFGFIGANGAGKSTTIKCITGILPYNDGSIEIAGYDMAKDSISAKKNIGYVSDNHSVYDKLTGREYVNFLANIYGVSKQDRDQRLNDLSIRFDLQDKLDSPIKSYSHGMKQKICVIGDQSVLKALLCFGVGNFYNHAITDKTKRIFNLFCKIHPSLPCWQRTVNLYLLYL